MKRQQNFLSVFIHLTDGFFITKPVRQCLLEMKADLAFDFKVYSPSDEPDPCNFSSEWMI